MPQKDSIKKLEGRLTSKQLEDYKKKKKNIIRQRYQEKLNAQKEQIEIKNRDNHLPSLKVVDFCVIPFTDKKYDYAFFRTEPFYSNEKPNFDVLLKKRGDKKAVLIECKHSLRGRIARELRDFEESIEEFEKNVEITDMAGNTANVKDFVAAYGTSKITKNSGRNWDFEYALASEWCDREEIQNAVKDNGIRSFCLWRIQKDSIKPKFGIRYSSIKGRNGGNYIGHRDATLKSILNDLWDHGYKISPSHNLIDFTIATDIDYIVYTVLFTFWGKNEFNFDYQKFCDIFEFSMLNYFEGEKKFIFKNLIEKCLECKLAEKAIDRGNIFKNSYYIKTLYTKDENKYKNELIEKLAKSKVRRPSKQEIEEISLGLLKEMIRKRGDKTLGDYD